MNLLFLSFLIATPVQAHITSESVFTALNDASITEDISKTKKFTKALFIAHDCHSCHSLLKRLKRKCLSLDVTTYAVGNAKNLKSKLKMLKKLKVDNVFLGSTTQSYADIGIDLIPYYISSKGEKYEANVYNGLIKDGVCKLKSKTK